ncbi:acyl-CoA dehydrogenase family protein [Streptomyces sp. NPDC059957]|uniref:acyl-CoA dehydrogenase family protein n=1 Tax=Streptomyces sp. NPDC059957 TaxID=3347016 RepID=UPI00365411A2
MTTTAVLQSTIRPDDPVPNTFEGILARAEEAAPVLLARGEEIERARRLPADVVELMRSTGVFRMAMPKSWGGPQLTSLEQNRVIEALATGDSAAAWCAMIGMDTWIYAGYLDEDVARRLLPRPDMITAGSILPNPRSRAERVPGGYRVTGHWQFGSGVTHCDVLAAGVLVHDGGELELHADGSPNWRVIVGRPEQFEIIDTWFTTGLAGSGSQDYKVTDLFVPEEHTFSFGQPLGYARPGAGAISAPDAILRNMPGVPLGVARAAIDHVRGMAATRVNGVTGQPWSDNYRIQLGIAEAEMELAGARAAVFDSLRSQWDTLESARPLTIDQRALTALARVNSFRVARSVVAGLYDLVATSAIYRPSPLDRWLRDLTTMNQHIVAQDQIMQSAGAALVGGTPQVPFSLGIAN